MSAGRRLVENPPYLGDFHPGYFVDFPPLILVAYFNPLQGMIFSEYIKHTKMKQNLKISKGLAQQNDSKNQRSRRVLEQPFVPNKLLYWLAVSPFLMMMST
jgi:hypothetical protein